MTRSGIVEYAKELRIHYLAAWKEEKGKMLDQFTMLTGCHRKAAIRLLHRGSGARVKRKRGRPRRYGEAVVSALRVLWEASDRLCSRRLHPFLPELVRVLRRHGDISIAAEVEAEVCRMSPSTIDRLLQRYRRLGGRRLPMSTTRPGSLLKDSIPIRTNQIIPQLLPLVLIPAVVPLQHWDNKLGGSIDEPSECKVYRLHAKSPQAKTP